MKKLISFEQFKESLKSDANGFGINVRGDERSNCVLRYKGTLTNLIQECFGHYHHHQQSPLVNLVGKVTLAKSPQAPKAKGRGVKAQSSAVVGDHYLDMQEQTASRTKLLADSINFNLEQLADFESLTYWVENNDRLFVTCLVMIDDTLQQIAFDRLLTN